MINKFISTTITGLVLFGLMNPMALASKDNVFEGRSLLADQGRLFNTSTLGNELTINTTVPGQVYSTAGVTGVTTGFSFSPNTCLAYSGDYCLFSVGSTTPTAAKIDFIGYASAPTFQLCLNAAGGPSNCETQTIQSRYAYITDNNNNVSTVTKCSIDSTTGLLRTSSCVDQASNLGVSGDYGIALNPSGTFVYFANNGVVTNPVDYCVVNPTNGAVSGCKPISATLGADNYDGLVFNAAGTILYLSNQNSGAIFNCAVTQTTGDIATCTSQATITPAGNVNRLAINPAGTWLYVTQGSENGNNGAVYQCPISASGTLGTCALAYSNTGVVNDVIQPTFPIGITINASGTVAYIANNHPASLLYCYIDAASGNFTACTNSTVGIGLLLNPEDVHINSIGTLLYVANAGTGGGSGVTPLASVTICPIDPTTGALVTPCVAGFDSAGGAPGYTLPLNNPRGITLL